MDTSDEIPLEDHQYFQARLDHLESRHPAFLLSHLTNGTLTNRLREVVIRTMQAKADLVINKSVPEDQADELVRNKIVADPQEQGSPLRSALERAELRRLLAAYKAAMPNLPRTYLSQSEIIE